MGDVFGDGVLVVNGVCVDVVVFFGFVYCVVVVVKVFVFFEMFGEVVWFVGEFVVELDEVLFFRGEGLGGGRKSVSWILNLFLFRDRKGYGRLNIFWYWFLFGGDLWLWFGFFWWMDGLVVVV